MESIKDGETKNYRIHFDRSKRNIIATDKETGEIVDLIREPFEQDTEMCALFVRGEWCYYLSRIRQVEGIRVYGIEMQNFEQKLIFNNVRENKEDFYGILSKVNTADDFIERTSTYLPVFCFFIDNESIYYGVSSQLIRINRETGKETVLALDVAEGKPLFYHHGDIYYVDKQHRLCAFKEEDGGVRPVDSIYTDQFTMNGNRIEYKDLLDHNKTRYYNIRGSSIISPD